MKGVLEHKPVPQYHADACFPCMTQTLAGLVPTHPAGLVWASLLLQGGGFAPGGLEMDKNNTLVKLAPKPKVFFILFPLLRSVSLYNCLMHCRGFAIKLNKTWREPSFIKCQQHGEILNFNLKFS